MKPKEILLVLVITTDLVTLSLCEDSCRLLLEKFSESSSKFTKCATQFARPIKMCRECKEDFLDVRKYYDALEHAQEEGIICKDILTSQDKVEIIKETYNFIISSDGLWAKGFCSSCYSSPFTYESGLTNNTKMFFGMYDTVRECFSLHPDTSNTTEPSEACSECREKYDSLQDFYKEYFLGRQFPNMDGICFDVLDSMNTTQHHWGSGHYQCERQIKGSAPLITAVLIVLSSPVLLYLLVRFSPGHGAARERLVAHHGFLTQTRQAGPHTGPQTGPQTGGQSGGGAGGGQSEIRRSSREDM